VSIENEYRRISRSTIDEMHASIDPVIGSDKTAVTVLDGDGAYKTSFEAQVFDPEKIMETIAKLSIAKQPKRRYRARPEMVARLRELVEPASDDWPLGFYSGIDIETVPNLYCLWEIRSKTEIIVCTEPGIVTVFALKGVELPKIDVVFDPPYDDSAQLRVEFLKSRVPTATPRFHPEFGYLPLCIDHMPARTRAQKRRSIRLATRIRREAEHGRRPSKGVRKHIRKQKAEARRA
jgi:hypothetical protein